MQQCTGSKFPNGQRDTFGMVIYASKVFKRPSITILLLLLDNKSKSYQTEMTIVTEFYMNIIYTKPSNCVC